MSDLSATQCGCQQNVGGDSCCTWIIILILLFTCCGNNGMDGCGCGNGIGSLFGGGDSGCDCMLPIIIILLFCCCN